MYEILDINLAGFEEGTQSERTQIVQGMTESLKTGFIYVGHDLSSDVIDEAYALLKKFFDMPIGKKQKYAVVGSKGGRGYTQLMVETAASASVPDFKEMLNWGYGLPAGHPLLTTHSHQYGHPVLGEDDLPGITETLMKFHEDLLNIQTRTLRIIALGLGMCVDYFDEMLVDGSTLSRAIHYPHMSSAPSTEYVWAAEHTDINLITILPRSSASGLQVFTEDGWIAAEPPKGYAIVNAGMMLERISNGMIPAAAHRVIATDSDNVDRYSMVQFAHPTPWTILAPAPSCVTESAPLAYAPISAGDALTKVLWEINLISK